jgi:hypothetical protein
MTDILGSPVYTYMIRWIHTNELEPERYGFKWLGAGMYRRTYLGPDNLVYKVEHTLTRNTLENWGKSHESGYSANKAEWVAYLALLDKELPNWASIPKMTNWGKGVLVAEYVNGEKYELRGPNRRILENLGMNDLHYENVRKCEDGMIYVIDLNMSYVT